jgi:hypothetical protein
VSGREARFGAERISHFIEALALSASKGVEWFDAELHRRKGELLLADPTTAEQALRQAIAIARDQSAKLFELRA